MQQLLKPIAKLAANCRLKDFSPESLLASLNRAVIPVGCGGWCGMVRPADASVDVGYMGWQCAGDMCVCV